MLKIQWERGRRGGDDKRGWTAYCMVRGTEHALWSPDAVETPDSLHWLARQLMRGIAKHEPDRPLKAIATDQWEFVIN